MTQLLAKPDGSLAVVYNNPELFISVKTGYLSSLPENRMLAHWHEDLEFLQAKEGMLVTRLNGNDIILDEGDIIFINSRQVHLNYSLDENNGYRLIQIHPRVLAAGLRKGGSSDTLLRDIRFRCYIYKNKTNEWQSIHSILNELEKVVYAAERDYELMAVSHACKLYYHICLCYHPESEISIKTPDYDLEIQRAMISFMYAHYSDKLSLDEIAVSGGVSRSKCCRLFQQYLNQSPMDFLNDYRLEESCHLLSDTNEAISNIALTCGFTDQSYFTRIFKRKFSCSPREYRKKRKEERDSSRHV